MANTGSAKSRILGYKSAVYGIALFLLATLQTAFFTKINVPKYLFLLSKNVSSIINFGLTCSLEPFSQ